MENLIRRAKQILKDNQAGGYTMPSPRLYPHQWNWDTGFIAIGYSGYDQEQAQAELVSLFQAQWGNGMVPHIVFNPAASGYFPGAAFWQTDLSIHAPVGRKTSGITQPPIHATAAALIYQRARNKKSARAFLEWIYPRLVESHRYFYRERDPRGDGLAYIRHPWESGIDNSPIWDVPLGRIKADPVPRYLREDLKQGVPPEQRPTDEDYDKYVYLAEVFKKHRYDEASIFEDCTFIVQDALFNAVLARANKHLITIGREIGANVSEIEAWRDKTDAGLRKKLWNDDRGLFNDYDLKAEKLIAVDTASGFMPLFAEAPTRAQADRIYGYLESKSFCAMHQARCFSVPNFDMRSDDFDSTNYWRGPIWINMNWMLMRGLRDYGFPEKADSVKTDIVELVRRYGFYEYFDPVRGRGLGSENFSWTAALFLDVALGN